MPNQSGKIVLVLVLLLLILGAGIYFFILGFKKDYTEQIPDHSIQTTDRSKEASVSSELSKKYSSKDLKISFEYPDKWFLEEKYYFIMLTSYKSKINSNQQPIQGQVEIDIHNFNGGCHETIDENLKDPACGEGGPNVKPNEILSKETEDLNGVKLHKYLIKYPSGKEQKFYFLEKGDRILQIDKNPDPSMLDKEFMDIVKSIKFLNE